MCNKAYSRGRAECGLTLIELLIFIIILGVAATAMLGVFGSLTRNSASLLPDKQAQAIAAGMLEEILAQPHTFCDPNAPNAATATAATVAACGGPAENGFAPEIPEARNGATPFDNVNDYHSPAQFPVAIPNTPPATGVTALAGLPGYTYQVTVANVAGGIAGVPAAQTLRVTVTVRPSAGAPAILDGVRIRYTPNT